MLSLQFIAWTKLARLGKTQAERMVGWRGVEEDGAGAERSSAMYAGNQGEVAIKVELVVRASGGR